nr:MAG TPA: helix-turn-helix domain protein [Caudoviricetes sp.]
MALGYSVPAIAKQIGVSTKVINVNTPYSRCRYKKQ